MVLEDEGYTVETAANGAEALEKLRHLPAPSVVLLDLMMPVMNGWRFLQLVNSGRPPDFPVVVVSADDLRKSGVRLGGGLSWEATFQDLLREIIQGGRLANLTKCRHLIVAFGSEGEAIATIPRGFYLRPRFTGAILPDPRALPAAVDRLTD